MLAQAYQIVLGLLLFFIVPAVLFGQSLQTGNVGLIVLQGLVCGFYLWIAILYLRDRGK